MTKVNTIKMSQSDFRRKVLSPLEREFDVKIYYSGEEAERLGFGVRGYLGLSFVGKKVITIIWQRNFDATVQTLFHELAHRALHEEWKKYKFKGGKSFKEMEAELVAERACDLLDLPYRAGFRGAPDTGYVEYHREKFDACSHYAPKECKEVRIELIEDVCDKIYAVVKPLVK